MKGYIINRIKRLVIIILVKDLLKEFIYISIKMVNIFIKICIEFLNRNVIKEESWMVKNIWKCGKYIVFNKRLIKILGISVKF